MTPHAFLSKRISLAINVDNGALAIFAGSAVAVLHSHDPREAFVVDVFKDVAVVDLARARFVSTRVVADLEVGDFAVGVVDIGNQIAFGNLLVVQVIEDFARRTVDRLAYLIRLGIFVRNMPG